MSSRKRFAELSSKERIKIFLECVEELKKRPFIEKGLHSFQFQILLDKETGKMKSTIKEGDIELLRSFLTDFRKFISNNEPANIDRILNTCIEHAKKDREDLIEALKEMKTNWSYQYRRGVLYIETAKTKLTPEHVLDLWINGLFFHSDNPDKREKLDTLLDHDVQSVKLQLLYSLPILTETILVIGAMVSKAFQENEFNL